jgi:hypothetical protein
MSQNERLSLAEKFFATMTAEERRERLARDETAKQMRLGEKRAA